MGISSHFFEAPFMSSSQQSNSMESYKQAFRGSSESLEHKLCIAINNGDTKSVWHLLKEGANVNSACLLGRTALGTACHSGQIEVVNLLLQLCQQTSSRCNYEHHDLIKNDFKDCSSKDCVTFSDNKPNQSVDNVNKPQSRNLRGSVFSFDPFKSEDEESFTVDDADFSCHCGLKRVELSSRKTLDFLCRDQKSSIKKNLRQRLSLNSIKFEGSTSSRTEQDVDSVRYTGRQETNQGYFIVVHGEDNAEKDHFEKSTSVYHNEPQTPDGMDSLEWDSDFQEKNDIAFEESPESEAWIDLYRLYADHLSKSHTINASSLPCIDVNQQDAYHRSAMHYAAEQGHIDIMHMLINAGCNVDVGDSDDVTPLHLAAARDHPAAVALLVSCGATVNRQSLDRTGPLHMAAARGFLETAKVLLINGANVNALDRNELTPLMLAAARGLHEMVALLISFGAKVNMEDIRGYTALCQAVWQLDTDLVHLLLSAGAKLTHSDRLLHFSILHRCADVAELLIEAGSVVNLRDDCGDTPLHIAARTGQVKVASLLLHNDAVVNYPNGITGSVPLHEAVQTLRAAQVKELKEIFVLFLNHGAKLNPKNSLEETPLSQAYRHGNDYALILLIQYGADVIPLQVQNLIVSEWYLKKRPEHFHIAQLMVCAGLNLWKYADSLKAESEYLNDSPMLWIARHKFNPMPLSDLSRLKIRCLFGANLYKVPSITSWPSRLRKIIMLEDVVSVTEC